MKERKKTLDESTSTVSLSRKIKIKQMNQSQKDQNQNLSSLPNLHEIHKRQNQFPENIILQERKQSNEQKEHKYHKDQKEQKESDHNVSSSLRRQNSKHTILSIVFPKLGNLSSQKIPKIKNYNSSFILSKKVLEAKRDFSENKNINDNSINNVDLSSGNLNMLTELPFPNKKISKLKKQPTNFVVFLNNLRLNKKNEFKSNIHKIKGKIRTNSPNSDNSNDNNNNSSNNSNSNLKEDLSQNNNNNNKNNNYSIQKYSSMKIKRNRPFFKRELIKNRYLDIDSYNPFLAGSKTPNLRSFPVEMISKKYPYPEKENGEIKEKNEENINNNKHHNSHNQFKSTSLEQEEQIRLLNDYKYENSTENKLPLIIGSKFFPPDKAKDCEQRNKFNEDWDRYLKSQRGKTVKEEELSKSSIINKLRGQRAMKCFSFIRKKNREKYLLKKDIDFVFNNIRKGINKYDDWNKPPNNDNLYDK